MRIDLPHPQGFLNLFEQITGTRPDIDIQGISTDSREVKKGDLYIAIKGERVDGHSFLPKVFEKGAACALVENLHSHAKEKQVVVNDTVKTLGEIANAWRKQFNIPVIGITGSNGKTSTKELMKHVLSETFEVHATEGNFNTSIGLPLTLLQLTEKHQCSILEMGANHAGDIAVLCHIAEPTHGLITNVAPAHLEGFGSIEVVAETKAALFLSLSDGIAFINKADPRVAEMKTLGKTISYGLTPDCDFPADIHHEKDGTITLTIDTEEIPTGTQNLSFAKNVIAITTVARIFEVDWKTLKAKVNSFKTPEGRCQVTQVDGITVIDDTYNANLESTLGAVDYLKAFTGSGKKILVFGDMFELGESSADQHKKVGEKCVDVQLSHVFTIGQETFYTDIALNESLYHKHFESKDDLLAALRPILQDGDQILVKGSRGMAMETIVEGLLKK